MNDGVSDEAGEELSVFWDPELVPADCDALTGATDSEDDFSEEFGTTGVLLEAATVGMLLDMPLVSDHPSDAVGGTSITQVEFQRSRPLKDCDGEFGLLGLGPPTLPLLIEIFSFVLGAPFGAAIVGSVADDSAGGSWEVVTEVCIPLAELAVVLAEEDPFNSFCVFGVETTVPSW